MLKLGLGEKMMGWISAIYHDPETRVKVNETLSESLSIRNGNGCPLSPLLFALVLEPFLWKIRQNKDIKKEFRLVLENKVSAYAENIFPFTTLPILQAKFHRYLYLSNISF